jgi:hypothetical protein
MMISCKGWRGMRDLGDSLWGKMLVSSDPASVPYERREYARYFYIWRWIIPIRISKWLKFSEI